MFVLAQEDPLTWPVAWLLMIGIALLLILSGLLVKGIAERGADGRLSPNGVAGIRTKATMASEESWLAAHQAGRGPTIAGAWVMMASGPLAIAIAVLFGQSDPERTVAIWGFVLVFVMVLLTGLVILGAIRGNRAAKEVNL